MGNISEREVCLDWGLPTSFPPEEISAIQCKTSLQFLKLDQILKHCLLSQFAIFKPGCILCRWGKSDNKLNWLSERSNRWRQLCDCNSLSLNYTEINDSAQVYQWNRRKVWWHLVRFPNPLAFGQAGQSVSQAGTLSSHSGITTASG